MSSLCNVTSNVGTSAVLRHEACSALSMHGVPPTMLRYRPGCGRAVRVNLAEADLRCQWMCSKPNWRLQAQLRGFTVVSESAIFTPADVSFVQECGCKAILVGESLVKQNDPEAGVKALLAL